MELRESILRTVCYFDLFDHPLTRAETRRWLFESGAVSFTEVEAGVDALLTEGILKEERGMVSLADREGLAGIRAARYRHSCRKWKRARRWARVFAALPGVRLVGIGNTLAFHNAKDDSDIDFFIITAPGTIWRTRFFCAALAALFDLRPRPGANRDKLCLSFFVTDDHLNIYSLLPTPYSLANDIYLHYWIRQMAPLAGDAEAAQAFVAANPGVEERGAVGCSKFLTKLFSPLGRLPGGLMKNWQIKRFPPDLRQAEARRDGSVVVSERMLKFHVNDRRRDIYEKWQKRVDSILS